jgi:hypothetical protein
VRDATNTTVANQVVGMRISVLQTTANGTAVYVETQAPTTNANGLLSIYIGAGSAVSGTFSVIDWSTGPYSVKIEIDLAGGTAYAIIGTTQLVSVPYALHAKTVTQPTYTVNTLYPELGGYVIAVRDGGKHGLVVAMQDQGRSNWYDANDLLSDANNHDVNGAKFMDWRVPTKRELNLMYGVYIGGNGANLNENSYWSSSEHDVNLAWLQNFGIWLVRTSNGKNVTYSVRAVRAF